MRSRSSTSSSEVDWRPLGLAVFLTLLGLVAGSAVTDRVLHNDTDDKIAQRIHLLDTAPFDAVVLGSSLSHAAVDPAASGEGLDLLNLAGPSMGIWEAIAILSESARDLSGKTVVVEVTPWGLNHHQWHPILHVPKRPDESFYRWAKPTDRFAVAGERATAFAHTVLPVLRLRRPLSGWVKLASSGLTGSWPRAIERPKYHTDAEALAKREADEDFAPEVISTWHLRDFEVSRAKAERLRDLVELARSRGARVVMVTWPLADAYFTEVRADSERWAEVSKARAAVQAIAEEDDAVHWIHYESWEDLGTNAEHYADYGHMNSQGAAVATRALVKRLAQLERGPAE